MASFQGDVGVGSSGINNANPIATNAGNMGIPTTTGTTSNQANVSATATDPLGTLKDNFMADARKLAQQGQQGQQGQPNRNENVSVDEGFTKDESNTRFFDALNASIMKGLSPELREAQLLLLKGLGVANATVAGEKERIVGTLYWVMNTIYVCLY